MQNKYWITSGMVVACLFGLAASSRPESSVLSIPLPAIEKPEPLPTVESDEETPETTSVSDCGFDQMGQLWDAASDKLYSYEYESRYNAFFPENLWKDSDRVSETKKSYRIQRQLLIKQNARLVQGQPFYQDLLSEFDVIMRHPSLTSVRDAPDPLRLFLSIDRNACSGALTCRHKSANDILLVTPLVDDLMQRFGADTARDGVKVKLLGEIARLIFVERKIHSFESDIDAAAKWYNGFKSGPSLPEAVEIDTIATIMGDLDQMNYLNQLSIAETRRDFKSRSECMLRLGSQY